MACGLEQFVLELKGMNVGLHDRDYQQVASDAGGKGVRWALLTDGRVWIVLDEHLPGPYSDRIVLKIELSGSSPDSADDLAALLDPDVWSAGRVQATLEAIRQRQEQRRNEALIFAQKRPLVEGFQRDNEIGSFERAAHLYAQLGKITETERDVLLGRSGATSAGGIPLTFSALGCTARVMYFPKPGARGLWRLLAGSRLSTRSWDTPAWTNFNRRRRAWVEDGTLQQISDTQYELTRDCEFASPSDAACMVCVRSVNGWDAWKDAQGRTAQHYRTAPAP